tara:strand:- start:481 stop:1089 length:609 start_codon:yes stop_codon:yes gene_type:complete
MAFKMKGNPMKRNFGVGASPTKQHNMEPESTASEGALAKDVETESEQIFRGLGELGNVTDVLKTRKFRRDRLNLDKDGRKLTPGTAKKATSGAISKLAKKAAKTNTKKVAEKTTKKVATKASPNKLGRVGVSGMGSGGRGEMPEVTKKFYKRLGKVAKATVMPVSTAVNKAKEYMGKETPQSYKKKQKQKRKDQMKGVTIIK